MPNRSTTGSVADLFATLGLDASPLADEVVSVKALIQGFAGDAIVSLKSIQQSIDATATQMGVSLGQAATGATVVAEALTQMMISGQSAKASLLGLNVAVNDMVEGEARAAAAMNEIEAQISSNEAKRLAVMKEVAIAEKAASEARILRFNQEAQASAQAAAIDQATADARILSANQMAAGEARAAAIEEELANARVAFANEVAAGTARAEAMQTEAVDAAVKARILRYNQEAEAEMRAAAIRKEAEAADSIPVRLGLRAGPGGVSPTVGSGASGLIAGGVAVIAGYEAIKQFAAFDDAMNKSLSIMKDVTEFQKSEMTRVAKDLAVQYGISATEIAHGFYTLASAGRDTEDALKDMPAVVKFAFTASADGVMKISTAAETLTSVFNALKGSGQSIEHISDLLIKADSIAQGTGEQFAKALAGKGAGAIQILGKSAEEGLAILATMAKAGIPAAQQQNALIQILRDLPKEAEKYASVMITLNGHQMTFKELLYDSSGQMKDFSVILKELETLFSGASTEVIQHDLALLHLNNRTNQSLQAMLGMSGVLSDYEKKLKNAAGATQEVANIRLTAVKTDFEKLGEAARNAAIDIGTALTPAAGFFARKITDTLVTVHDLTQGILELGKVAYHYAKGDLASFSPAPPKPPAAPPEGTKGTGSVADDDPKVKAAAERAAQERNRIQNIRLTSAQKAEEAMVALEIDSIKHQQALRNISDSEAERQLLDQNEKLLQIQEKYELKKLSLETTKKSGVYEATVEAQASAAASRKAANDQKVTDDAEIRARKKEDAIAHYHKYILDIMEKDDKAFDADDVKRQTALTNDANKALQERTAGLARHQTQQLELVRQQAAYEESTGQISANQRIQIESALDQRVEDIQRTAAERELALVNERGSLDVQYASKKVALENELTELADRRAARQLKVQIQILKAGEDEIRQLQNKIKFEQEYGDGIVSVAQRNERLMAAQMEFDTLRGKSNSQQMIDLQMQIVKTDALRDRQHELGIMFKETQKDVGKLWADFGEGVSTAILAGGKFWAFWKVIIKDFEHEIMKTLVNGVLKTLKDNILALPGVSSSIGKVFGALGLGGGKISMGEAMGPPEATAAQVAALGTNTTATIADATSTDVNAASTDVNAAATVANAAATTANAIVTTVDVLSTNANTAAMIGTTATQVSSRLITNAIDIQSNLLAVAQNALITTQTGVMLGLTAAVTADTAATTGAAAEDAIASGASAAGGIASGVAGAAASQGVGAIVGMVTGAITAVSSVIGNFQMAGMNKSLDLIENYTRYLKIGLVEQGDSLLNDSHVIRNTLTDFMAWNWGVATSYYQQICEKLDALIGGGGVPGVTMKPQMAMAGGGGVTDDIYTASGEMVGSDNSVTIDLSGSHFEAEVSDKQVDAVFQRGVDKAKRAGAFRPGTWPR